MFDNTCKFLAENFPDDFATWLLGKPVTLTTLSPQELSVEPIRADSLILLQSEDLILHIEFQTLTDEEIPFRMTDYRLRGYRRFPYKDMLQVVIYLKKVTSKKDLKLVKTNTFKLKNTTHRFEVIRLWEQPTSKFMTNPGLLPFAVLNDTNSKDNTLQSVATQIENITNPKTQNNIIASTGILAGLVLDEALIQRLLRRDNMRESVIYQSILQEGAEETRRQMIISFLKAGASLELITQATGLTVEQIQQIQAEHEENQQE